MEAVGTMSEVEWTSSFTGMCSEEADFMAQLLGNSSLPNEVQFGPNSSSFWPGNESNVDILGADQSSLFSFSLGSSSYAAGNSHDQCYNFPFVNHSNLMTSMEGDDFLNQEVSDDSVALDVKPFEDARKVKEISVPEPSETSKKRPRSLGDFQKNKRMKKCAKFDNDDDNSNDNNRSSNAMPNRQSSSACCSEDESNASHEANGVTSSTSSKGSGALNLSGKTRAGRGSATDPQSLYARKRREKINERLKILQQLVPNGTKVDISTMLEEAVEYVKFLQLQIKLLSNDDLWMYAPIAYNGMDIGLDLKFPPPRPQS